MKTLLNITMLLFFTGLIAATNPSQAAETASERLLVGSWTLTERPVDGQGQPCPFVPERIEFFGDQTLIMSNMPGNRVPFKTNVTADERAAVSARMPALMNTPLLLIKPVPQIEWRDTPIAYGYSLSENKAVLTLIVPGWSPAKFRSTK